MTSDERLREIVDSQFVSGDRNGTMATMTAIWDLAEAILDDRERIEKLEALLRGPLELINRGQTEGFSLGDSPKEA